MATIRPFSAVRPAPEAAPRVAAVPYDVVDVDEARALAQDPLSFLHVSRPEIDLPSGTDPHADRVYRAAAERYDALKRDAPFTRDEPSIYLYRLQSGDHTQTGVAACYSLDDYDHGIIKKHERTRPDKEDDRTRHILELRAQTGPVFLTYRPAAAVNEAVEHLSAEPPLVDFEAPDGVRHSIWRVPTPSGAAIVRAFSCVQSLYIADGHHRAAGAARARQALALRQAQSAPSVSMVRRDSLSTLSLPNGSRGGAESDAAAGFLAVAFPADQVRILPYNRIVKDLGGRAPEEVLRDVTRRFGVSVGSPLPYRKGEVSMYLAGRWYAINLASSSAVAGSVIDSLDCNILQGRLLGPVLDIGDIRTDARVGLVGGARGPEELERMVNGGQAAVAFSLYPVSMAELMMVSDAGLMMPPKSTWFEPKLRDGLLVHEI
jgi:uncharacterized protein (DUF1015 family)